MEFNKGIKIILVYSKSTLFKGRECKYRSTSRYNTLGKVSDKIIIKEKNLFIEGNKKIKMIL